MSISAYRKLYAHGDLLNENSEEKLKPIMRILTFRNDSVL
jgi:hypothetical protein